MGSFFSKIFGTKAPEPVADFLQFLGTDMHAHVLPGLDDGTDSMDQALAMVREMVALGYHKLILTPHVMGDFYKNTSSGIRAKLTDLQEAVQEQQIKVELACAAEYYLDEWLLQKLADQEPLLTFGPDYVLFETSFINEPFNFSEAIFRIKGNGYTPVLAHPERYVYFHHQLDTLAELRENGVLLQINLNSLSGYYGEGARRVAEKLINQGLVDLAGTDAHSLKHLYSLQKVASLEAFEKLRQLPLRNQYL
jgi:tyrosine-protein phosphatase YwqE